MKQSTRLLVTVALVLIASLLYSETRSVDPLILPQWHSSDPWNARCPGTAANRANAGSHALALAKTMKYWAYPTTGIGSVSYVDDDYGTITSNFAQTINWNGMSNTLVFQTTQRFIFMCGASVYTDYELQNSSSTLNNVRNSLINFFSYDPAMQIRPRGNYTNFYWKALIRAELDAARPVIYTATLANGREVAFIVDGYDESGLFHINWSDVNVPDAWVELNSLSYMGETIVDTSQQMLTGIRPSFGPPNIDENFETDFSNFNWQFSGHANWTISTEAAFFGTKSAKSGNINANQNTSMYIQINVTQADTISFYKRVSCEAEPNHLYDHLAFFIDGVEMQRWSGDGAWEYHEFPVSAGVHEFRWTYSKDGASTYFNDCAWVDAIDLPEGTTPLGAPRFVEAEVFAGNDVTLNWAPPAGTNPTLIGYRVFRNGTQIVQYNNPTQGFHNDYNLPNGDYSYHVRALYTEGLSGPSNTASVTVEVPYAPTNLVAELSGVNTGHLMWQAPPLLRNRALMGYKLYRDDLVIAQIESPETLEYFDTGLAQGAYYYKVSAVYAPGESAFSNTAVLAVGVPEPPLGLQATVVGGNSVYLSWQQVSQTEFLTGFKIFRNGSLIHSSDNPQQLYYSDLVLPNGSYTYHVRAVYGDVDSGNSAPATVTIEVPYPPTGLTATVTGDDVTLTWANPQSGRALTHYYIYRDSQLIAAVFGASNTTYQDLNRPNGVYSYRVTAFYSGVESAPSGQAMAVVEVLYPPTGLQASVNLADVHLSWNIPATQGGLRAFLGYKVYRNGALVATINGGTNNQYTDDNLANGIYNYGVSAFYNLGESTQATIAGVSVEVLYPVAALNYQVSGDDVSLWWNAPPNSPSRFSEANRSLLGYRIFRDGSLLAETAATNYDDLDLANGIYQYWVSVVYSSGVSIPSPSVQLEVEVLYPPTNLQHSVNGASVSLVWDLPATSGGRGLLGYKVYRDDQLLGMVPTNSFMESGLANGVYIYKVSALYAGGESAFSNSVTAVVEVLYSPNLLQHNVLNRNDVALAWQAPQTGPRSFLAYRIYRNGTQIHQTTDLNYIDTALADGHYSYHVTALYDSGESQPSNSVSPFIEYPWPPTGLAASVDQDDVNLSWEALPGTQVRYQLFRDGVQIADLAMNAYTDANLANGSYAYYLTSSNASESGISDPCAPVTAIVEVLYPPTGLTYQTDDDDVILSWTASATSGGLRSLLGYDVHRDGVIIARTGNLSYTDSSLPNGVYQYYVTAAYDSGDSQPSNTVIVNLELLYPPSALTHVVNGDDVSLNWTAAPSSGGLRSFNGYNVYRDGSLIANTAALSYDDLNLANGIYQYYVTALYSTGESAATNTETAYVEVLYAPSGLTYQTDDDDIILSWSAALNQGRALLGYRIYKDGAFLSQTNLSTYTDTNLPNGIYQYYVTALWDTGESTASNTVTVNLEVLYPATALSHVVNGDDVSLSWTAPVNSGGLRALLGYKVMRDGNQIALVNTTGYDDLNLANGVYVYSVIATYDSGDATPTNEVTAIVEVLYAPTALTHTVNGDDVTLNWTAAATQARSFLGYKVYRDGSHIATTFDVTYTDSNLANGVYQYYVTALYSSGESLPTNTETAIVEVLYPPSGLTYQTDDDDIILSWTASETSGGLRNLLGYDVHRDGVIIARTANLTYTDSSLPNGVYQYYVTAAYDSGDSQPSNTVIVNLELLYPPSALTHVVNGDDVSLNWTAAPSSGGLRSFNGYNVYRDGSLIATTAALSYDDLNLANGIYQYYVTALYSTGESAATNTETAYVEVLYAPSGLTYQTYDDDIILSWSAAPNQGRALLGYRIYKDGAFLSQTNLSTYTDANLPNGIYQYYVTALWDSGESTASNTVTVNLEVLYPATALSHVVNGDDVSLSWTAPVNSGGLRALLGYKVMRDGSQIALVNTTGYDDLNLANGVYVYSVIASYDSGDATPTNEVTAIVEVLYAPTALTYTVNGDDVTLNWTAAPTQARSFLGYKVYRDGSLIATTFDVTYTDSNLANGVYQYYVTALYSSGESLPTNTETAIVEVLYPPTGLTYQTDDDDIILSWTASATSGGLRNLLGYDVHRDGVIIARTGNLSYTDSSLPNGIYQYYITAAYDSGESQPSNTVTVNLELLYPPSALTHVVNGDDVSLSWTAAPSSGGLRSFNGYNVYRDGSLIATTAALSYDDLNLANGIYQYYVKALYTTGESAATNTETAYVEVLYAPSGLTYQTDDDDIILSWSAAPNQGRALIGYRIYKDGAFLSQTNLSTYTDASLPNGIYQYYVTALWDTGESSASNTVTVNLEVLYPATALSHVVNGDDVSLSWTAPVNSGGLRALLGYKVMRDDSQIALVNTTSYDDLDLANGVYIYSVIATYDSGDATPTNEATASVEVLYAPTALTHIVNGDDVTLNWTAAATQARSFLGYKVYRDGSHIATTLDVTYTDSNLANGIYQYYVTALYSSGESLPTNTETAIVEVLYPPSGLTYQIDDDDIILSWTASAISGGLRSLLGYDVHRDGVIIARTANLTYTDSSLPNGVYQYYITAAYDSGDSQPSNTVTVNLELLYPPSALTHVVNGDDVSLSWTAAPSSGGLRSFNGYNIYRDGSLIATTAALSYDDLNLANGIYQYYVKALYTTGESAATNTETAYVEVLYPPSNLSLTADGDDVSLTWTAPINAPRSLLGYKVYRNGAFLAQTMQTAYSDLNLANGLYSYQVSAFYDSGESILIGPVTTEIDITYPVTALSAVVNEDDVTLSWTLPAISTPRAFQGYFIYRNGALIQFLADPSQSSWTDFGLPNGDYSYYLTAVYDAGFSIPSNVVTITVNVMPNLPSPTALGLSMLAARDLRLTWQAPSPDVLSYYIYRNDTQIATTTELSYDDLNLPNGSYQYYVKALYTEGLSSASNSVIANIMIADPPTGSGVVSVNGNSVSFSWNAPGQGEIGYIVYRNGVEIAYISNPLITFYTDANLPNGDYLYQVAAVYPNVISMPFTVGTVRVLIAYAPSALDLSGNGNTVNLSWTAPSDLGLFSAYNIYRNGSFLAQSAQTAFTDGGLANGSYSYYVTALYQTLESAQTNTQSYTASIAYAPSNLNASVLQDDVNLSWTGVSDLGGFIAYRVYRDGALVHSTAAASWQDSNLANGSYGYQISALYSFGESSLTEAATATVELAYPATNLSYQLSGNDVLLSWTAAATSGGLRGFLGYKVYRDGALLATTMQTGYTDPDLANGSYLYHVVASYSSGDSTPTPSLNVLVELLYAPTGLSHSVSQDDVTLSWSPVPPEATTLTGYRIYRDGALIATTLGTGYTDSNLPNGSHSYVVRAAYPNGESDPTNSVTAFVEVPYAPQNLDYSVTGDDVSLTWQAPPVQNRALQGYQLYRNDVQIAFVTGLSYLDADLPNGNYNYYLIAQYSSGVSSPGNTITVPVFVTYVPTGISVSGTGTNRLISWNRPNQMETGYRVYRNNNLIGTVTDPQTTSYSDLNLSNGIYVYQVAAVYPVAQESQLSTPVQSTVMIAYQPANLQATEGVGINEIIVNWQAPADQGFLTGYRIRLYRDNMLVGTQEVAHPTLSTMFTGLPNAYYEVFAAARYADGITSLVSDELGPYLTRVRIAYPPAGLTATAIGDDILLNWNPPIDTGMLMNYTMYHVYNGVMQTQFVLPNLQTSFLWQDRPNGDYQIMITAKYGTATDWVESDQSNTATLSMETPYPPSNLEATVQGSDVFLSWTAPAVTYGLQYYVIMRNSVQIATTTNLAYGGDVNLPNGTYNYQVYAVFGGGPSSFTNTVEVTIIQAYQPLSAAVSVDTDDVLVSWTAPSVTQFLTGYKIYRDAELIQTVGLQLSYTDLDRSNGNYAYGVVAVFVDVNSLVTGAGTAHVEIAYPPSNLNAAITGTSINATWTAPTDLGFFQFYRVFLNGTQIAEQAASSYSFANLPNGNYVVGVEAVYQTTVSTRVLSSSQSVLQAYPAQSFDLTVSGSTVNLSWLAPLDATGLTAYQLWRDGSLLSILNPNLLSYEDVNVSNGTHLYTLKTLYQNDQLADSGSLYAEILVVYAPSNLSYNISDDIVQLLWQAPSDTGGLTGYNVYRNNELLCCQSGPGFTDGPLLNGSYTYWVTAVYNSTLESASTNSVSFSIQIAYSAEEATAAQVENSFRITWLAPSSGNIPDHYKIWFLTDGQQNSPAAWTLVGQTDSLSIVDSVHGNLIQGDFLWAVEAVFGELEADPSFTNILPVDLTPPIPSVTKLLGNYPNPFNPTTNIVFWLKQDARVRLEIYNARGQKVRTLVNGQVAAGRHSVAWDGKDGSGRQLSSGVYLYRMEGDGYTKFYKMIMMK